MGLYTHTHTHTHTDISFNERKARIATCIVIAIICGVVFFINKNEIMKNRMMFNIIGRNKIGEGAELNSSDAFFSSSNVRNSEAVDTSNWDLERVNIVYDTENVPVPVPKGFTASSATGEHTVNTGFVIYEGEGEVNDENAWDESCNRNQFVWVPVYDTNRVYEEIGNTGKKKAKLWEFTSTGRTQIENVDTDNRREPGIINSKDLKQQFSRYGMQGYSKENFYKEIDTTFIEDMKSLEKYGGFYIGRYETGNILSEKPVVQRMNTNIRFQNWYQMYNKIKNINTNENIQTKMIWGCLWDETLQWFIDTEAKDKTEIAVFSSEFGNYYSEEFNYKKNNGTIATKNRNYSTVIPTGSTERNKINNIYDMAGNMEESTMERGGTSEFIYRGGYYNSYQAMPISNRTYDYYIQTNIGYRSLLLIK